METIEITREKAIAQIEIDRQTKENLKAFPYFINADDLAFYDERIAQLETILEKGHGTFSTFRNEQAEIILK